MTTGRALRHRGARFDSDTGRIALACVMPRRYKPIAASLQSEVIL